jgi:hypothetical protein
MAYQQVFDFAVNLPKKVKADQRAERSHEWNPKSVMLKHWVQKPGMVFGKTK